MLRNLTRLSGAAVASQIIAIVSAPLLLRFYPPEAYGVYLGMTIVTSVCSTIVTMRYELAIQATKSLHRVVALVSIALCATLTVTTIVTLSLWFGESIISRLLKISFGDFLYFIPIVLIATGVTEILRALHWRQRKFSVTAASMVLAALVTVVSQLMFGLADGGAHGVLVGAALGQLAGAAFLAWRTAEYAFSFFSRRNAVGMVTTAWAFRAYPSITMPAGIVHMLASMAPAAAISSTFGPAAGGMYYLGSRLISAPVNVLSSAVYPTFVTEAAILHRDDPESLLRLFWLFVAGLLLLMSPALLLFPIGDSLFATVFGEHWRVAGSMAAWIVVGEMLHLAATSTSVLTVLRFNALHAAWVGLNLLFISMAIAAICTTGASPIAGVAMVSVVSAVSYAFLIGVNFVVIMRRQTPTSEARSRSGARVLLS